MRWLGERKKKTVVNLDLPEVWLLLILKASAGWVRLDKIMAIMFLLERVYGLTRARFVPGRIPWSQDVKCMLERLASHGLVEAHWGGAYRLTESGRMAVERYSMKDPRIKYPYADIRFFIDWDIDTLAEYIMVNYPEWVKS
jgi:hypothetical protein